MLSRALHVFSACPGWLHSLCRGSSSKQAQRDEAVLSLLCPNVPLQVPELIFGNLLTSSNYNDNEKKVRSSRLMADAEKKPPACIVHSLLAGASLSHYGFLCR